jgi:hypothetical protein
MKEKRILFKIFSYIFCSFCLFGASAVFALTPTSAPPSGSIASIAGNIQSTFGALNQFITAAAYVIGFAFMMFAIFKFKKYRDAPTQHGIGEPIAWAFISVVLLFLPSALSTTAVTVFGTDGVAGGISGVESITAGKNSSGT